VANAAAATIGSAADAIDTALSGALNASATSTGDIFVTESDGLVLGAIDAGTGNATLTATAGSITDDGNAATAVAGNNLTLNAVAAGGAIGAGAGSPVGTAITGTLTATANTSIDVSNAGTFTAGAVTAGTTVGLATTAGGDLNVGGTIAGTSVALASAGNIVDAGGVVDATDNASVDLSAVGSVGSLANPLQLMNSVEEVVTVGTVTAGVDVALAAMDDGVVLTEDFTVPNGTIQIDTPATIEFQMDTLSAGDAILLNTNILPGDINDTRVATIYRLYGGDFSNPTQADLTLTAGNAIGIGEGQRFSTPGNLVMNAGNDVTVADVAALDFTINSATASVYGRSGSQLFASNGILLNDTLGDIVANSIAFNIGAPMTVIGGPAPAIATQNASAVANAPVGSNFARARIDGSALTPQSFVGFPNTVVQGQVLDLRFEGVDAEPNPFVPPIPEEITMGGGLLRQLNEAAQNAKPVWGSEVVAVLTCSLYEGEDPDLIPAECRDIVESGGEEADPRFQTEPMVEARRLYQQLYADVDPLLDALQDAADAYLASAPSGDISGEAFRQFVERSPELDQAHGYLQQLSTLFSLLDEAMRSGGGEAGGVEDLRAGLLDDIAPTGMSPEELDAAIKATPPLPRTAGRTTLAATDGIAPALLR
jgi:hypothetical protein